MYALKPGTKENPEKRWALPDRIFFGFGACHILAGVFLEMPPVSGFYAERIVPHDGFWGNHIYVTNGIIACDYHGYSRRDRMLHHYMKGWRDRYPGWGCTLEKVDFHLLDTVALNQRKMLGPDQYLHNAIPRARRFIERINHEKGVDKAYASTGPKIASKLDFSA
ncbi:MAG: hypothetical protein NVV72_13155 [Asticcacaulis sp.]|nr:hypothetical protein [Asticcacaulis sp.]